MFEFIKRIIEVNKEVKALETEETRQGKILLTNKVGTKEEKGALKELTRIDNRLYFLEQLLNPLRAFAKYELLEFFLEEVKNSKVASKPVHYQSFDNFLKGLKPIAGGSVHLYKNKNIGRIELSLLSDDLSYKDVEISLYDCLDEKGSLILKEVESVLKQHKNATPQQIEEDLISYLDDKTLFIDEVNKKYIELQKKHPYFAYFNRQGVKDVKGLRDIAL